METGGSHSYSWLGLAGDSTRSRKDGMPIASFPGGQITGATVRHMVTEATAQAEAVLALHERFRTGVMLTCMDLSLEAEAFGAEVQFGDDEVPTVVGQRIRDLTEIHLLPIPPVGAARTGMALRVVGELVRRKPGVDVLPSSELSELRILISGATPLRTVSPLPNQRPPGAIMCPVFNISIVSRVTGDAS